MVFPSESRASPGLIVGGGFIASDHRPQRQSVTGNYPSRDDACLWGENSPRDTKASSFETDFVILQFWTALQRDYLLPTYYTKYIILFQSSESFPRFLMPAESLRIVIVALFMTETFKIVNLDYPLNLGIQSWNIDSWYISKVLEEYSRNNITLHFRQRKQWESSAAGVIVRR